MIYPSGRDRGSCVMLGAKFDTVIRSTTKNTTLRSYKMSESKKLPKGPTLVSPSEMEFETPLTSPADVGQLSGGEVQQFSSETAKSKKKRESGR